MDSLPASDAAPGISPPPPPGRSAGPRRLRRLPDDGPVAGVCAGVAEYFDVDPVLVRIATVVLFFSGPGFFAYVLAWIFVPAAEGPAGHGAPTTGFGRRDRGTQILGILLLGLGLAVISGDWWGRPRGWLGPVGLMALGGWLLLRPSQDADAAQPTPAGPEPSPDPTWAAAPHAASGTAEAAVVDPTTPLPLDGRADGDDSSGPPPPWAQDTWMGPPEPPTLPPRRRQGIGAAVFGALLLWTGVAWLVGAGLETGLAGALLILGGGFVVGAFVGSTRVLILPALAVAGALALTTAVDVPLAGPVGAQRWEPRRIDEVADRYEVSIGEGTLDLGGIVVPAGDELVVEVSVGLGHLVVVVPEGLAVEVTSRVGAGEIDVFGKRQDGVGVSSEHQDGTSRGTLVLDLHVGMGRIDVDRATATAVPDVPELPTTNTTLG